MPSTCSSFLQWTHKNLWLSYQCLSYCSVNINIKQGITTIKCTSIESCFIGEKENKRETLYLFSDLWQRAPFNTILSLCWAARNKTQYELRYTAFILCLGLFLEANGFNIFSTQPHFLNCCQFIAVYRSPKFMEITLEPNLLCCSMHEGDNWNNLSCSVWEWKMMKEKKKSNHDLYDPKTPVMQLRANNWAHHRKLDSTLSIDLLVPKHIHSLLFLILPGVLSGKSRPNTT